jgi:Arc/MetJ-type ribon-helix-helix transcriptional regulator
MKTEKVSVNLSPVELGQIDYLVERGLFDNRSDFIRTAARKSLEGHSGDFRQFLEPEHLKEETVSRTFTVGVIALTKGEVGALIAKGRKLRIRVIGLFTVSGSITPEEIRQVVLSCKVHGKLMASKEVKEALRELEEQES